jgi:hypothetical protein
MLITLRGDEYLPVLEQWRGNDELAAFVGVLADILVRGDHAIDAPPKLLEDLSEWEGLSPRQSVALRTMAPRVARSELPFDAVTHSLVITGPAGQTPDPGDPGRWHRRDWRWLQRNGRLDPTVLGGEHLRDAEWYLWLGRAWGARLRPGSSSAGDELRMECRLLGGGSAEQVIRYDATHGKLVLSIIDSDSDHPGGKLGQTATDALKARRELPEHAAPVHVETLRARDVENVLPLALLEVTHPRSNWLADMARRGFFARRTLDPELAFVDLGKEQCERRMLDVAEPALTYRCAALARIRRLDPTCTASATTCERPAYELACTEKQATRPKACVIVHNVGKPLRDILVILSKEQVSPCHSAAAGSVAAWLATMLPDEDDAVLTPARLVWSWGLRAPPRLLSDS